MIRGIETGSQAPDLLGSISGEEKDLVMEFVTSSRFNSQRRLLREAALAVSDPAQDGGFLKILIASYIFENIATYYLAKVLGQNDITANRRKIVLSPDEVVRMYGRIRGADSIENKDVLQRVIEGVTMPDSLEFIESPNTLQLVGIWDAKLGDLTQRTINQHKVYKRGHVQSNLMLGFPEGRTKFSQIIHEIKPDVPDKPVIIPNTVRIGYLHPIDSNLSQSGYRRIQVPIERSTIDRLKQIFTSGRGIA